jgi:hypothetical protein
MMEDKQLPPADAGRLDPCVRRPVPERAEWEHLLRYSYAPGNYMNICQRCGKAVAVGECGLVMPNVELGPRAAGESRLERPVRPNNQPKQENMGTKDLTHKAIARALANGEPLTHDQRAALLSLVADDKVWQRKHDEMADQMRAYAAAAVAAEGERWKEPADERKQVEHADAENRALRRLLAVRVSGASLYTDDGELQDNSQRPFIDYYCDSPAEIHRKLQERAKRKHDEMADQMRAYAAAAVAAERELAAKARKLEAENKRLRKALIPMT